MSVAQIGLFLTLCVIWSSSFLLIKIGIVTVPPVSLTAARLIIAALLLTVVVYIRGERLPKNSNAWFVFAFIGFFGNALPFILISWGEKYIDSGLAAILMGIMPITTVALAHLFIADERITPQRALGVLIGFCGLLVLVGWQALEEMGSVVIAQLAVLCAAICYGITTVFTRTRSHWPGPVMSAGATITGALFAIPLALFTDDVSNISPDFNGWFAIIVLGVFQTAIAALIYFHLIRNIGASRLSQINYVIPVMGALWGVMLLGEQPDLNMLLALALVLTGITLVNTGQQAKS